MFRKKRQPAPFFRQPGAPFNPATGDHATLGQYPGKGTTLALFQVIGDDPADPTTQDTHDNYVVCRGYEADNDPTFRFLHDPYTAPATTPINVAKPYSVRGTFPYEQGQVIVAARIRGKLGFNPGKAETTVGQPADLDEETVLLTDDDDVGIAWMDIGTSPPPVPSYFHSVEGGFGNVAGTMLDCTWGLPPDVSGDFSWTDPELTWNGAEGAKATLELNCRMATSGTPTASEWFTVAMVSDFPAGYPAALGDEHIVFAIKNGDTTLLQPLAFHRRIVLHQGTKYRVRAQRILGSTGTITMDITRVYWSLHVYD